MRQLGNMLSQVLQMACNGVCPFGAMLHCVVGMLVVQTGHLLHNKDTTSALGAQLLPLFLCVAAAN